MDQIQDEVIELRGLSPNGTFTREILSPEELQDRVLNDFFTDYTPEAAKEDAQILSIFGLINPDYDLVRLYQDLFSEQIAGFYDRETTEMVVVGSTEFGGAEKLTYAHEYNHALQDQNYDYNEGLAYNEDACEEDSERCAAVQALLEGDSILLESQWLTEYSSMRDKLDIFGFYTDLSAPVFDSAPSYLQQDFLFPYEKGAQFVAHLFEKGGWDQVNLAYENPPLSTEQILHPEKYPHDVPIPVDLPDFTNLIGDSWELIDDNVMGEWYTYLILAFGTSPDYRLDETEAAAASAGWGGDRYVVYLNRPQDQFIMVMKSTWDTALDQQAFADAFLAYGNLRFGTGSSTGNTTLWESDLTHLFTESTSGTIWIAAPDAATAEAVLNEIP